MQNFYISRAIVGLWLCVRVCVRAHNFAIWIRRHGMNKQKYLCLIYSCAREHTQPHRHIHTIQINPVIRNCGFFPRIHSIAHCTQRIQIGWCELTKLYGSICVFNYATRVYGSYSCWMATVYGYLLLCVRVCVCACTLIALVALFRSILSHRIGQMLTSMLMASRLAEQLTRPGVRASFICHTGFVVASFINAVRLIIGSNTYVC